MSDSRERDLLDALVIVCKRLGARVRLGSDCENLVRLLPGAVPATLSFTSDDRPRTSVDADVVAIEAEGLENLLHEFVHMMLSARLDDDHGFDYGRIPLCLDHTHDRACLWEELACCVVSCAYVSAPRRGEAGDACRRRVDAWFREQVEIQPVFYGLESEPDRFWTLVRASLQAHRGEADMALARAYRRCEAALTDEGMPRDVARPPVYWTLDQLLSQAEADAPKLREQSAGRTGC